MERGHSLDLLRGNAETPTDYQRRMVKKSSFLRSSECILCSTDAKMEATGGGTNRFLVQHRLGVLYSIVSFVTSCLTMMDHVHLRLVVDRTIPEAIGAVKPAFANSHTLPQEWKDHRTRFPLIPTRFRRCEPALDESDQRWYSRP